MAGLLSFIQESFWHVAPILGAAAIALMIIIERLQALFVRYPMHGFQSFFERIGDLVMSDRLSEAIALCERYKFKPTAIVTKEALLRAHQPDCSGFSADQQPDKPSAGAAQAGTISPQLGESSCASERLADHIGLGHSA